MNRPNRTCIECCERKALESSSLCKECLYGIVQASRMQPKPKFALEQRIVARPIVTPIPGQGPHTYEVSYTSEIGLKMTRPYWDGDFARKVYSALAMRYVHGVEIRKRNKHGGWDVIEKFNGNNRL